MKKKKNKNKKIFFLQDSSHYCPPSMKRLWYHPENLVPTF